jgi:multiple sugar transport system ATP-binding protein
MSMAIVRLEHVQKKFGRLEAIKGISFTTTESEFWFILGPSGAGKTTILSLIAGILPLTSGDIYIGDSLVNKTMPKDRNVAIAFESYALYPNRTVYGNIRFPLDAPIRKDELSEEEKETRIREVAELLQISELLKRYPRELSGGQRQRVALGRTLVRRPNVFLLDEPIAHLDAKLRHQMRGELKRLQQQLGIPIICSTPDQSEAVAMADHIIVLNKGTIEQIGDPRELYFRPRNEFVGLMLGEPKMSVIEAALERRGKDLYVVNGDLALKAPPGLERAIEGRDMPQRFRLGIRHTDVEASRSAPEGGDFVEFSIDFYQINGEKAIITAKRGDTRVVAELDNDPRRGWRIGEPIWLKWSSENFYAFDRDTGLSLFL